MERITAFKALHQFYRGFEGIEMALEETIGKPVCMSGCGKCCEVNTVKCMTIEAMNAISVLLGQGNLDKIVSIAEGWLLDKHNEAPSYQGMIVGGFIPSNIRTEWEALSKLPCPFLDETKRCLMHKARPMVCRAYGVTNAASGFCPRPPGKGETLTQFMYMNAPGLREDIQLFKKAYHEGHQDWVTFGFLPTMIYRAARENEFRRLVADNRIATAKIIGTTLDTTLMWQPQLDALKQGVAPDLLVT